MQTSTWYRLHKNNKIIHILVWIILFSLPVLFSFNSQPDTVLRYLRDWLPLISSGIIFYINFLWCIDRFLFKSNYWTFFLINAFLIVVITFLTIEGFAFLTELFDPNRIGNLSRRPPLYLIIFRNATSLILTIAVAIAIKSTFRWQFTERRQKQMEQEHLESELVHLKNQLNPHFFFNTLNNIYTLIAIDQDKAQDTVHRLSKMMRYLLYDSNEKFVPLSKEIEFINHYIDLMELRLSDHVKVTRAFHIQNQQVQIAPLLFISLIENAFKHGVSATQNSEVEVRLSITAEQKLIFAVKNTAFPKEDKDLSGSGIGLENLDKRLNLLYPGRHSFKYGLNKDAFEATLTLQL